MTTTLEGAIDIASPVEKVFGFVTEATNDPTWQPTVRESTARPPGSYRVGTQVSQRRRLAGFRFRSVWEVLEVVPNRWVRSRMGGAMAVGHGEYSFQPTVAGTRFSMKVVARVRWWMRPLEPLLRSRARLEVPVSLARLKATLEAPLGG